MAWRRNHEVDRVRDERRAGQIRRNKIAGWLGCDEAPRGAAHPWSTHFPSAPHQAKNSTFLLRTHITAQIITAYASHALTSHSTSQSERVLFANMPFYWQNFIFLEGIVTHGVLFSYIEPLLTFNIELKKKHYFEKCSNSEIVSQFNELRENHSIKNLKIPASVIHFLCLLQNKILQH